MSPTNQNKLAPHSFGSDFSQVSETNKAMMELQTKLKFYDRKVKDLERENDSLQSNVQNLEGELEEVQDNFREDEDDEYHIVKRRLEALSKDNRVLSFKLKKSEKSVNELSSEKTELEGRLKQGQTEGDRNELA